METHSLKACFSTSTHQYKNKDWRNIKQWKKKTKPEGHVVWRSHFSLLQKYIFIFKFQVAAQWQEYAIINLIYLDHLHPLANWAQAQHLVFTEDLGYPASVCIHCNAKQSRNKPQGHVIHSPLNCELPHDRTLSNNGWICSWTTTKTLQSIHGFFLILWQDEHTKVLQLHNYLILQILQSLRSAG